MLSIIFNVSKIYYVFFKLKVECEIKISIAFDDCKLHSSAFLSLLKLWNKESSDFKKKTIILLQIIIYAFYAWVTDFLMK